MIYLMINPLKHMPSSMNTMEFDMLLHFYTACQRHVDHFRYKTPCAQYHYIMFNCPLYTLLIGRATELDICSE